MYAYLSGMTAFKFVVQLRQVPHRHVHTYTAVDVATGEEVPLLQGGDGKFLGCYPEIQAHLKARGIEANMTYTRQRGDTFDPDYTADKHVWTFKTGGEVIVEEIPRLVAGGSLEPG